MKALAHFVREHKNTILERWMAAASRLPSAQGLSASAIRDHIPQILDRLADAVEAADADALALRGLPNVHAVVRLQEGYDLRQVATEYRLLRHVIMEQYAAHAPDLVEAARPRMVPLMLLHEALDRAVGDAVDHFAMQRDRAREMFIAILGHDLREPLQSVLVGAQLLASGSEASASTAARVVASAQRMGRMIADLLDFARGHLGGGIPIVPTPLDARVLLTRTVQEMAHAHPDRLIRCVMPDPDGPLTVIWDADRLAQAIGNLVTNAVLHGGDPVTVTLREAPAEAWIEVQNPGEILPGVLPTLFDPFGGSPAERPRSSLGLGLYIVRRIVEAHGGAVDATSADGATVVRMKLPLQALPQPGL